MSDLPVLKIGDICAMTGCTVVHGAKGNDLRLTFKAPKNTRFVFAFAGYESDDDSAPLDFEKRMNELGWYKKAKSK